MDELHQQGRWRGAWVLAAPVVYWGAVAYRHAARGSWSPALTLLLGAPSPHPAYALLLGLVIELAISLLPIWHFLSRFRYPSVRRSPEGLELRRPWPLRPRWIPWLELSSLEELSWFGPHDTPLSGRFVAGGVRIRLRDGSAVAIHRSIEGYERLLRACQERTSAAP